MIMRILRRNDYQREGRSPLTFSGCKNVGFRLAHLNTSGFISWNIIARSKATQSAYYQRYPRVLFQGWSAVCCNTRWYITHNEACSSIHGLKGTPGYKNNIIFIDSQLLVKTNGVTFIFNRKLGNKFLPGHFWPCLSYSDLRHGPKT